LTLRSIAPLDLPPNLTNWHIIRTDLLRTSRDYHAFGRRPSAPFAERPINAQALKKRLDGEQLIDPGAQLFTQAGWSTTMSRDPGKKGKASAASKKKKKSKEVNVLEL